MLERQFQSRHAPLPRVRNEEEDNAADGFDARPWEQTQNARLRSRGLNTVIQPGSERIQPKPVPGAKLALTQ